MDVSRASVLLKIYRRLDRRQKPQNRCAMVRIACATLIHRLCEPGVNKVQR